MKCKNTNCLNCGAPIEHRYNHQCPYCKTFFDYRVEKIQEINPKYMINVKISGIERIPFQDSISIHFIGDYQPYNEIIEYSKEMTTMIIDYNSFIPKKVCYAITIPMIDFIEFDRTGNIYKIFEYLPFELDKREIAKALINFRNIRYREDIK